LRVPVWPDVRAKADEFRLSSKSALRLGTFVVRLTLSEAAPSFEFRERAVPLAFDNVVTVPAAFDLPKMKVPPVAATAVPPPTTVAKTAPATKAVVRGLGIEIPCSVR
jgi:hypothetical protein